MRRLLTILALAGLTAVATAQNTITKSSAVVRPAEQAPAADRPDSTGLYNAALLESALRPGAAGRSSTGTGRRTTRSSPALERRDDLRQERLAQGRPGGYPPPDPRGHQGHRGRGAGLPRHEAAEGDLHLRRGQAGQGRGLAGRSWTSPAHRVLEARGQNVGILVTDDYTNPVDYGGWLRLRVLTTTNVAEKMKPPAQYDVKASPANLVPTGASAAEDKVEVVGQPRMTQGHPCTLWDEEDIAHYKDMLKTSQELQAQYAGLKKRWTSG